MLIIHVEGCYRLKFDLIKVNPMSGRLGQYFLFKRFKCFIGYALDNYGDSLRKLISTVCMRSFSTISKTDFFFSNLIKST